MSLRALLLDAGNTVVYLDHAAVAEVVGLSVEAVAHAEAPAKRSYEACLRGGGSHEDGWSLYMREVLVHAGASGDVDAHVRSVRAAHDVFNLWRRVPDGLVDALRGLRAEGWRVGVVSNSEGRLMELFERLAIDALFEVVVDSALVGMCKPDPRIFHLATEALEVAPHEAIYVGDIPAVDVDGALAAGLSAALVDTFDVFPDFDRAPRYRHTTELVADLRARKLG
jgi:putative hydrolase of the HAD superfamily